MAELNTNIRRGRIKPYASVPRIDWSHPLAKGLQFYAYDAGGYIFDLVNSGVRGTVFSSTTHAVRTQSPFGYGFKYGGTATSDSVSLPASKNTKVSSFDTTAPYSIACGLNQTATSTLNAYIVSVSTSTIDDCGFGVNTATSLKIILNNGNNQTAFTSTLTNNAFHTPIVVVNANGTSGTLYWDGKQDTTFTAAASTFSNPGAQVCFNTGHAGAASLGGFLGFVYYFAGWNRILTAADAALLHSDPYGFLIYPEDELFTVGVVASGTLPFNQYDWSKSIKLPAVPFDQSVALNPNLFTNPVPIMPTDRLPNFRVPLVLPEPPKPLNPNLFTNPVPIFNSDQSSSKLNPDWLPAPPPPLNINLFKNPYPFNQIDWSNPFRSPDWLPQPQIGINPNIFTNPYPVQNQFVSISDIPLTKLPDQPYNQNLYTVTVVANPFIPQDFSKPFFPKALPLFDQALNPNLFTNPYPIQNQFVPSVGVAQLRPVDAPYNQNLYQVVVTPQPFLNQFVPTVSIRALPQPDQSLNINLFTNPFPFNQYDFLKPVRTPQAPIDLSFQQGQLLTNPFPFNQYDFAKPVRVPQAPVNPDQSLNINLFTNPYPIQNIAATYARSPAFPLLDQPYNQNLYGIVSGPLPFNTYDFPQTHAIQLARYELSQPLNPNIFTNPIPVFNFGEVPAHPVPALPLNQSVGFQLPLIPVVAVTLIQRTLTGVGL